jgi:hypothetical protein
VTAGRLGGRFPPGGGGAAGGAGQGGLGAGGGCLEAEEALGVEGLCGGFDGTAGGERGCIGVEELAMGTRAHGTAGAFPLDTGRVGR